jgi:3-oxoacyl-[acyl-carrier protein] reductase
MWLWRLFDDRCPVAHDDARPGGRIILFSSTQHLEPMPGEVPYALSKGAI